MVLRHISLALILLVAETVAAQFGVNSSPSRAVRAGEAVFFVATTPATGAALFRTDGTEAGTRLVFDPAKGEIGPPAAVDRRLLFVVDDAELWRTDGVATSRVLRFGTQKIRWLAPVNGRAVLLYGTDAVAQLWSTDGTAEGMHHLRSFSGVSDVAVADGAVYFGATSFGAGRGLWRSDGNSVELLFDSEPDAPPTKLFPFHADAVFMTAPGTVMRTGRSVEKLEWLPAAAFSAAVVIGDRVLFFEAGTVKSVDAVSAPVAIASKATPPFIRWGGEAVFGTQSGLGITDGTLAGTRTLTSMTGVPLVALSDDVLLFRATDGVHGEELWRIDRAGNARMVENLSPEATIEGRVTDAATGGPAAGRVELVRFEHSAWTFVGKATLAGDGSFRFDGVPSGEYALQTKNSSGLIDGVFGATSCAPCPLVGTTPFPLLANEVRHVDVSLPRGARLGGRVTDAVRGTPIAGVSITVLRSSGDWLGSTATAADGTWRFPFGLVDGSYAVSASPPRGWMSAWFDGCSGCSFEKATRIVIAGGQDATANFALQPFARIAGVVRDAATHLPIAAAILVSGQEQARAEVDGRYEVFVAAGTYIVSAATETYDSPRPMITLGAGETAIVDLDLVDRGGRVTGRVVDGVTGEPVANAEVSIATVYSSAWRVRSGADGGFEFHPLAPGNYFLTVIAPGYVPMLYPAQACDYPCPPKFITVGTGMIVAAGDLRVDANAHVRGTITSATTGEPLAGVTVRVWFGALATTDVAGQFDIEAAPGDHWVAIYGMDAGAATMMFGGGECDPNNCTTALGRRITLAPHQVFDASTRLRPLDTIQGRVTDADTGAPLARATVTVSYGERSLVATTGVDGRYLLRLQQPASVFVEVVHPEYGRAAWRDRECGRCGDPLQLTGSSLVTIDFALHRPVRVSGRVTEGLIGLPLPSRDILAVDAEGTAIAAARSGADGRYTLQVGTGKDFFVVASERVGLLRSQFWRGADCDDCVVPPPYATPLAARVPASGIDFALDPPRVKTHFTFTLDGAPLAGAGIELYAPSGPLIFRSPRASAHTLDVEVPAGVYYLRTINDVHLVDTTLGGHACATSSCELDAGDTLVVLPGAEPRITLDLHRTGAAAIFPRVGPAGTARHAALYGGGFEPGVRVQFGGVDAAVEIVDDATLDVAVPIREAGQVEVTVIHVDGARDVVPGGYRYAAPCSPLEASITDERDRGLARLTAIAHAGGPAKVEWLYGQRGVDTLVHVPGDPAASVPIPAGVERYTARVASPCEERELTVEVRPYAKRRAN